MNFGTLGTGFGGLGRGGAGVAYETEASTLFAAMLAAGSEPNSTRKGHINTLIAALKTAGIWTELDIFYMLAAHSSAAALINWKNPGTYNCVAVNSPTFNADRGYTGDNSTSRLNTQYTPSTQGVKFTLNSASAWGWSRTNTTDGEAIVGRNSDCMVRPYVGGVLAGNMNDTTTGSGWAASGQTIGLFGISRIDASTKRGWKNGSQLGTDVAVASTSISSAEQWILGGNSTHFTDRQIAMAAWGASLTGLESAFYTAVLAYMQAVGAA